MTIRVLMLSLLLAAPLAAETRPMASAAPSSFTQATTVRDLTLPDAFDTTQHPFSLNGADLQPKLSFKMRAQDSPEVCYKIRAFVFKRDDDHAPELVRETTCGPGQPRARAAEWPKPKLVPAK